MSRLHLTGTRRPATRLGRCGIAALAVIAITLAPGCFTMTHTMGDRTESSDPTPELREEKQWFAAWGIVPLDPVQTHELAGDSTYYEVTTTFTAADVLVSALTSFVGFYRQTIQVRG